MSILTVPRHLIGEHKSKLLVVLMRATVKPIG